jgi:hypothetical protein
MKFAVGTLLAAFAAAKFEKESFEFMQWVAEHGRNYGTV